MKRIWLCCAVFGVCLFGRLMADEPSPKTLADEEAIHKMVTAYVEAFNKHDAKALAALWSPDAVYLNRVTGEEVTGRDAIAKAFVEMFKADPDVKLTAQTESVQFISPNVAVERGNSTVSEPKGPPDEVPYSAVYTKRDGKWLLDRVTDEGKDDAESRYEKLKPLEWMVGDWVDKDEDVDIETECNWTKNKTFLTRSFTVSVDDDTELSGMQIIGWDAATKTIKSWTFDSDGAVADATWEHKGDRWYISNHGTLADGRKAAMVNVIRQIDNDSYTWQTIDRTAGAELLPDVDEVLIVRK